MLKRYIQQSEVTAHHPRHCEEPEGRRGNPFAYKSVDCFVTTFLAMTKQGDYAYPLSSYKVKCNNKIQEEYFYAN